MMTNSMFHGIDVVSYQYNGRKERILKTVNGTEKTLYLRGTNDFILLQRKQVLQIVFISMDQRA